MSHRVLLASTFATEAVVPALSYWLARHQLEVELDQAPYGQVLEQVAAAGTELVEGGADLGVLLIRLEDYLRDEGAALRLETDALEAAQRHVEELASALSSHALAGRCPILLGVMPASGGDGARQFTSRARELLAECAITYSGLSWLDVDGALDLYSVREIGDPFRDEIAHIPFSEECLTAVATSIARQLRALWGPPCKVIALDCDNTLWRGACSEDPLEELDASGPFEYLRSFMHRQASSGRLLCLVSRNPEHDVARAFSRYGSPLVAGDVITRRCGWDAKADSLRSIAAELDLATDSFVFVDDDPLECAAVREQLPEVSVIEVPRDPDRIPGTLDHAWELDVASVTEADRIRRRTYAANRQLRAERENSLDPEAFVEGLGVQVSVTPMRPDELDRAAQLLQRTNQFNTTGRRSTESELRDRLAAPGLSAWVARVKDRLGDYGLVGVLLGSVADGILRLDQVVLSCRVFQRRVEQTMLKELLAQLDPQPTRVTIAFRSTGRNTPVLIWLRELGAGEVAENGKGIRWIALP
ncbi:MAG TPA: HAD-IIIC family phosphatase [Solirubrobacterales bacterium]|nr:HAD-IIIC family phosphatase [Solirubrobacterales bacterium]